MESCTWGTYDPSRGHYTESAHPSISCTFSPQNSEIRRGSDARERVVSSRSRGPTLPTLPQQISRILFKGMNNLGDQRPNESLLLQQATAPKLPIAMSIREDHSCFETSCPGFFAGGDVVFLKHTC